MAIDPELLPGSSAAPITNVPAFGGNLGAPQAPLPPGIPQQGQGGQMESMLKMLHEAGLINADMIGKILGAVTSPEHSPPSPISAGVPGEIRGQGLGNPATTGLAGFYANNPNMRVGEFDPTGSKNIGRFTRDYARQDQLGRGQHAQAMQDQRNQRAQGLSDLWKTREKMVGQGWNPANPNPIFSPLGD